MTTEPQPLSRRRMLRTAAIGAAAATVAGRELAFAPTAAADAADETGQVELGALLVSYASAPINLRGSVNWTVTRQRTDTVKMSSQLSVGTSFKADLSVTAGFVTVGGSANLAQAASSQVTDAVTVKSTQQWGITTSPHRADGINTVEDTTFFLVIKPKVNLTGNPTRGFRWKFLDGGIKASRTVAELRDPAMRSLLGGSTVDAILAQYPLLQNPSGQALGLGLPRYKLKDRISPGVNGQSFARTISKGSTFSDQRSSKLSITITERVGFTSPTVKAMFEAGQTLEITTTSVQEIDTTNIIGTGGQVSGDGLGAYNIYNDKVFKTILISYEGPLANYRPAVSGVVRDQLGNPVPGALVSLVDSAGVYNTAQADSSGAYTIRTPTQLPAGSYTVICAGVQQSVAIGSGGTATRDYSGVSPSAALVSPAQNLD